MKHKKKLRGKSELKKLREEIRQQRGSLKNGPSALKYLLRERRREARKWK